MVSISNLLARTIHDFHDPRSLGSRLRAKRVGPLLDLISIAYKENGCVNVLDIGGTEEYWNIIPKAYLERHNINITIVNLPGESLQNDHGLFSFIAGDGCDLSQFTNNSFHIVHSNSVLEHVGDWARMKKFSREVKRLSKMHFVQTPNFWFPVEPHAMTLFFHWLPKPVRIWLVMKYSLGHWRKGVSVDDAVQIVESARLLNKKMFKELFSDSKLLVERFLFFPKSFLAIRE